MQLASDLSQFRSIIEPISYLNISYPQSSGVLVPSISFVEQQGLLTRWYNFEWFNITVTFVFRLSHTTG